MTITEIMQFVAAGAGGAGLGAAWAAYSRSIRACAAPARANRAAALAKRGVERMMGRADAGWGDDERSCARQNPAAVPDDGPVSGGAVCPLCGDSSTTGSNYDARYQDLTVWHGDGSHCSEAPVDPDGSRLRAGWIVARPHIET
ncbi:hypothetical protein [Pseudonocardia sp. ICBG1142]|uniref:hypothetical protein n=1 Tax=Pseudonocardia sp. ICBG1142 TaxID=2846760 RepID=UPI001CF71075|nr:hypothetical protein [Pseudonocardia sp. ICBG1142]